MWNGTFPLEVTADLVWQHTRDPRRTIHAATPVRSCLTRYAPYGTQDPEGRRVHPSCAVAGCLDLVHDIVEDVHSNFTRRWGMPDSDGLAVVVPEQSSPEHVARYLNVVVAHAVRDLNRRKRVEQGMPAKPTRTDGVAARVIAALIERAPDPGTGGWWVTLFRLMRGYAARPHSGVSRGWPLDAWTMEKSLLDGAARLAGSRPARHEILRDLADVLAVIDSVAGPAWRHATITQALLVGQQTVATESIPEWHPDHPTSENLHEEVTTRLFAHHVERLRSTGASDVAAVQGAAWSVFGRTPPAAVRLRDVLLDVTPS